MPGSGGAPSIMNTVVNALPDHSSRTAPAPAQEHVDVSVLIPVLNEAREIRETVAAMQAQHFDGRVEFLFADGESEDDTRAILEQLALQDPRIRVLTNPARQTAAGLNVCLRAARGEYVARMDAHTYYANRYLAAGIERLAKGDTEWVSGPQVPRSVGPISGAVKLALASRLGRGGSSKWDDDLDGAEERELDTGVFCGVWRRERVLEAGGWDERWPINQDSEMASRFLAQGSRLVCLPEMAGYYVPRDSLKGLARQYYRYGVYRARTFRRHPQSMRRSHLIPPALALALIASVAAPRPLRLAARSAVLAYLSAVAVTAAGAAARPGQRAEGGLLLAVLPTMHLTWGFGSLVGMFRFGPPTSAFAALLGGAGTVANADDDESVYAPSLHGDV
jgi:succinoglycan biosynthesis protein ExoA